jgi:imidazolonepropionase-like amidohydrolase
MVATVLVDGAPAIRAAVADNARQGVDHIKIFASGGLGPRETATQASWSADEVRAAVEAAHAAGLPIVAHCHGGPSARPLIEAGVDTIEHGSFLARSELEAMADRGTYLDMTLGILLSPRSVANQHLRQSLGDDAFGRLVDEVLGTMRQAVELGVPITLGTDTMHGMLAFEAVSLAALGVPNEGVIETLTGRAATALGRRDLFGTLEEGRIADLLAVAGDPRQDLRQLEQPRLVVQRGQVVHREGAL